MAKADEAAKATKQEVAKEEKPPVEEKGGMRVAVTAPGGPFRRAGFAFGPEPVEIAIDDLTEDQAKALKTEPLLRFAPVADGSDA